MQIAIIGAGNIGGNCARQFARAGHEVLLTYSRDPARLDALAAEIGGTARRADPAAAVDQAELVVMAVPWGVVDDALAQAGSLAGRIVIDTTNQFGRGGPIDLGGRTAARVNAERMTGARYTKSFNTLTSAFQAEAAGRAGEDRVAQWVCGDDQAAKTAVMRLIDDSGYLAVDLGGIDTASVMEAPRRPGAVYGEEYRAVAAAEVAAAVRAGRAIPQPPEY